MMEDLPMVDIAYLTDAEMADYDYDYNYDIPETAMQDESDQAAPAFTNASTDGNYTSIQVQEYEMLEDGQEEYGADNAIEAEPLPVVHHDTPTIQEVVIDQTTAPSLPTELMVEQHTIVTESLPVHSMRSSPFDTAEVTENIVAVPAPHSPVIERTMDPAPAMTHALPETTGWTSTSDEHPPHESPKSPTDTRAPSSPAVERHSTVPLDSPHSVIQQSSLPDDPVVEQQAAPSEQPSESSPHVEQPNPRLQEPIEEVTELASTLSPPILVYHCDQPYHLFAQIPSPDDDSVGDGNGVEPPTVLLSGRSDLFTAPVSHLFNAIRMNETANFSWISEQYIIGLDFSALDLFIDESSKYADQCLLSDLCAAVVACGHESIEFTIYQAEDFHYSLAQRLQGIPPPPPEGGSESQEESQPIEDPDQPHVSQDQQEIQQTDPSQQEVDNSTNDQPPEDQGLPHVEDAPVTEFDEEPSAFDPSFHTEQEPVEQFAESASAEAPEAGDTRSEDDLDNKSQPSIPQSSVAEEFIERNEGVTHQDQASEVEPQEYEDGQYEDEDGEGDEDPQEDVNYTAHTDLQEEPPVQQLDDVSEYDDNASDGTLESSEHEHVVQEIDTLQPGEPDHGNDETDEITHQEPSEAPNADSKISETDSQSHISASALKDNSVDDDQTEEVLEEGTESGINEIEGTEPSNTGESAVPEEDEEYDDYYEEDGDAYEAEQIEDAQASTEEADAALPNLVDLSEDPPVTIVSPLSRGKRSHSDLHETLDGDEYTDHVKSDLKRVRIE